MDSNFAEEGFMGEEGSVISQSPSTLLIQYGDRQLPIPTANVVAIRVKNLDQVTASQSRVRADILVIQGPLGKNHDNDNDEDDDDDDDDVDIWRNVSRLKIFPIGYDENEDEKRQDGILSSSLTISRLPEHLLLPPSANGDANIHVIISTLSGTQKAASFFQHALKPLLDAVAASAYQVHRTESPESISEFTRRVVLPRSRHGIKQLIILLSGDGGIVDVVNALLDEDIKADAGGDDVQRPIVALIPMGTGNALFNSSCRPRPNQADPGLGQKDTQPKPTPTPTPTQQPRSTLTLSEDRTIGLRTLLVGNPRPLPTIRATFSPGSTTVSYPSSSSSSSSFSSNPAKSTIIHTPLRTNNAASVSASSPSTLHGCVLLSWCLHASLVSLSDAPHHRLQGSSRFSSAAKSLLSPSDGSPTHLYRGVISTLHPSRGIGPDQGAEEWRPLREGGDGPVRMLHTYILVTLVRDLEDGFTISPASTPLDGRLRLVGIGAVEAEEVVRLLGLAYQRGGHVGDAAVRYEEVEGLRIEFDEDDDDDDDGVEGQGQGQGKGRWRRVCVDGLIIECPKAGWVEVRKDPRGDELVDLLAL